MHIRSNKALADIINTLEFSQGYNGYAQVDQTWHANGLSAPFNRLYLVEEGQGQLWTASQQITMEPGKAYLIPAECPCSYCCDGHMRKYYFHYNLYKQDHYDLLWGSSRIGVLPMTAAQQSLLREYYSGSTYADALTIQVIILQLTTDYLRGSAQIPGLPKAYSPVVADTIAYILDNLSARLQIDALANRLFLSRTCLTVQFRKETGVTLGRYIDDQLMIEARRQLFHTDASIGTISRELGFCDQFYFSRRFKQLCGFTPLQYRKKQRSELAQTR